MNARKQALRHGPRTGVLAASIGALIASGGLTTTASGQDAEEENSAGADRIVVTGTRIRRDDFSAANATTVITGDEMQNLGVVSVADMVNQLPGNIATVSPEATAADPFYLGASIANMRGLNTGFGVRTLTLVDSRRVTPTNNGGGVDMNFIPSALVGRVETITGGASSTYGADAMAGVVNVILDDNVDNIRLDLNYLTTAEGDGDQYTVSFGTGAEFFDGRGQLTVGFDGSRQEAIEDCTTRALCQRGLGMLRNGSAGFFAPNYGARDNVIFEGQPEWIPTEGHRFLVTRNGILEGTGFTDENDPTVGYYEFNEAGNDLVPLYAPGDLTAEELAAVESVGTGTGFFSFFAGGGAWATPYGKGESIYKNIPLRPETNRDNLFTRFSYELEGGIQLTASLTHGQTESTSLQNQSRSNMQSFCVLPTNAYIQPGVMSAEGIEILNTRAIAGGLFDNNLDCLQAPYLGGTYNERDVDEDFFDFPAGIEFSKDFSGQVDRRNLNQSEATSLSLTATGALFEGGSWTWDAYAQLGHTENRQTLSGWRAARRWDMALDSVIDDDMQVKCSIAADNQVGIDTRDKWTNYITTGTGSELSPQEVQDLISTLSEGCVTFNPFGSQPLSPEALAYAFPTLFEGTDNDQTAISLSFSGDAWRGIGNAGPMQMAAGVDWRENETQNYADPNRALGADFNFVGNSSTGSFDRIYGDNWHGTTTTEEAWVEFDLPLLRNRVAADSLTFNTSFRRTQNRTERVSGIEGVETPPSEREVDSWKATMLWQPVDIMRVRMTRSADTRAPSANELYATNSYALESGGHTEIQTPFRFSDADTVYTEQGETYIRIAGGNANLQSEVSITETLGLVFQPVETLPGLQVSIDYYQTTIKGGIREISANQTLNLCARQEIGDWTAGPVPVVPPEDQTFCNNIEFGTPDETQEFYVANPTRNGNPIEDADGNVVMEGDPNPYYDYTNIVSIAESTVNEEDFVSRGIDYSVSYFTQLSGGGSISGRALLTRFLEQRIFAVNDFGRHDVSGQTGGNNITESFGSFGVNYSPTPRIRSNLFMTYNKNAFSVTAQARYTGSGKLNLQDRWLAPGDVFTYIPHSQGLATGGPITVNYDPDIERTSTVQELPSFTTLNLNLNYDLALSRFDVERFEAMSVYLNIENIGDRIPSFFSGTGAGGINTALFSGMGRSYRIGVNMEF